MQEMASLIAQLVKNLPAMQETPVQFLGWADFLENEMATHSSILAWEIPWTEELHGLQSMGSQKSRIAIKPQPRGLYPLQYSCLGNPMERGAWQATVHKVVRS